MFFYYNIEILYYILVFIPLVEDESSVLPKDTSILKSVTETCPMIDILYIFEQLCPFPCVSTETAVNQQYKVDV